MDISSGSAVPRLVRLDEARLHAATGYPADVVDIGRRRWRLAMANEHMDVMLDYRRNGQGAFRRRSARLSVDGRVCPSPKDFYAVAAAYHDLDQDRAFRRDNPTPMPAAREVGQAPSTLRVADAALTQRLPEGVQLALGYGDDCGWVIGLSGDHGDLRLFFTWFGHGVWAFDSSYAVQVIAGGRDLSVKAAGDMAKAIKLLENRGPATSAPVSGSTIGAPAGPRRTISTEVRGAVVIRV